MSFIDGLYLREPQRPASITLYGKPLKTVHSFWGYNKPVEEQNTVNLTRKVPTVAFDNIVIQAKIDGQIDILFYQLTTEGKHSEADVVAAIRVPSLARLKDIRDLLDQSIESIETHEP